MITLVCKQDKTSGKTSNILYADGSEWLRLTDEEANEIVQNNTVKNFGAVDSKFVYFETYEF